ncbi:MAG: DUF2333 family protein [Gammaproteobacteria bacterium]|nr:DUF2333 family protein [Gammaproteobacteria bacterium]
MFIWDNEPEPFDVVATARAYQAEQRGMPAEADSPLVTGYVTTVALTESVRILLEKPGGYLSNDKMPPGVLMDNMPNWEWGVLRMARDLTRSMRNDMSRSQTQSTEDEDLVTAETKLHIDSYAWMLPAAESEYRDGMKSLLRYLDRLSDPERPDAQFFARADNLTDWLGIVEKRLGDLSQRLSASVGQVRVNTDLGGDASARQATTTPGVQTVKTPWMQIDDVFYEARGSSWVLIQYLRAMEVDFASVLDKKNATVSVRQIVRELEGTQDLVWSPMILNGTGFGLLANHSLVMASYISRANAAVIDLRKLLEQG